MDNFPEYLQPRFEESGAVEEPFEEWWPKAKLHFRNVPDDVARHWLHQHWSHSPYAFLRSAEHKFTLVRWPSEKLLEVCSIWANFAPDNEACLAQGRYLVEEWPHKEPYRIAEYMLSHRDFPTPIIVLGNRDAHINRETVEFEWNLIPEALVLIEGHRRFNIALYLQVTGRLKPEIDVWLMEKDSDR